MKETFAPSSVLLNSSAMATLAASGTAKPTMLRVTASLVGPGRAARLAVVIASARRQDQAAGQAECDERPRSDPHGWGVPPCPQASCVLSRLGWWRISESRPDRSTLTRFPVTDLGRRSPWRGGPFGRATKPRAPTAGEASRGADRRGDRPERSGRQPPWRWPRELAAPAGGDPAPGVGLSHADGGHGTRDGDHPGPRRRSSTPPRPTSSGSRPTCAAQGLTVEIHTPIGDAADAPLLGGRDDRTPTSSSSATSACTGAARFLGSVPNRVAHKAPCSVLIARTGVSRHAWATGSAPWTPIMHVT